MKADNDWKRVVFASECKPCGMCREPICRYCYEHYADCDCPGPTQDEYEYKEVKGRMYAKLLADE